MKIILLSGGSGKRLWPLSNNARSKQFLKLLKKEDGLYESMVQRVWGQLEQSNLSKDTVIAVSKAQTDIMLSQLVIKDNLIVEPEVRDTFPAIALASTYLYSARNTDLDETIVVLPVDPYVEVDFFEKVIELDQVLQDTKANLALIGVKPTYPSTKYGYIVPEKEIGKEPYISVKRFAEKPTEVEATQLIEENALWNCGVFGFKLSFMLQLLKEKSFPTNYEMLKENYSLLPKISFDYEVVEKAKHIVSIPYNKEWKDLGTWNTLTEEMAKEKIGRGVISSDSKNSHLINELEIPVTIIGLSNVIVAASPDGILVSDKKLSPKIKDLVIGFNDPPRYEERIWGWSKVLDYSKYESEEMLTQRISITKGQNSSYHLHHYRSETWTIIRGEGELVLENSLTCVNVGDVIHIPVGKLHSIRSITDLEFIEVQTGAEISNADFVRLTDNWNEIISKCYTETPKINN